MEPYLNLGGNSGIVAYETGPNWIRIQFHDGATYLYTTRSAGADNIEMMKTLAHAGQGLNAYLNRNVRDTFAAKAVAAPVTGPLFAVFRAAGPEWDGRRTMREQAGWEEHARLMDDLTTQGFVVMGGPLGDGPHHEVLLVVQAEDEAQVRATLGRDPWEPAGILVTPQVRPWTVLLDSRRP